MAYKSDTIATIVKRLNVQYHLPAIQRLFIWDQDQIVALFDSIMRNYPIGSFLFWELDPHNRDKWDAYKFVENALHGGTRNELANTAGVQNLTLILDGQQRLTSLLIGLKGTYTSKKKWRRWQDPDSWIKQRLYLDLLKDPKTESEDGESDIYYGFKFFENAPINDENHHWYKVSQILDYDSEDRFDEFKLEERDKLPGEVTKDQLKIFEKNIDRLYRATWKDDFIPYYMEHDQDYDRVLDIFVRANEAGTPLNKSDLLLSMVTLKWTEVNAREEIYDFVERLNNELSRKNKFNKDFVMKSCLVLSDLPVAYKVQNFNNQNLMLIQSKWEDIKRALEKTVDIINTFGIDRDTLTSANAIIPIAYYLLHHSDLPFLEGSPSDIRNTGNIRRWITMALLNNVFGGSSDGMLTNIRSVLSANKGKKEFPLNEVNKEISRSGKTSYFNEQVIEDYLSNTYGGRLTFLALSLLYDDNSWGITPYHQDHIFPKSLFSWTNMKELGFTREQYVDFNELKDYVGNLELLQFHENQEKSDIPFDKWIKTRDDSFKKRHLISDDPELWKFKNFDKFIVAREGLIENRLKKLFGKPDIKEE